MADPILWPFQPNSDETLTEEYGYETCIIQSYSAQEQRIALRRHPIGSVDFAFLFRSTWEAQRANALLYRKHAKRWAVPLWHYGVPVQSASAGTNTIVVATAGVPWQDLLGLGPYAVLWRSSSECELVAFQTIQSDSVQTVSPLSASYSSPTWLLPARVARLGSVYAVTWENGIVASGRIRFEFESWE